MSTDKISEALHKKQKKGFFVDRVRKKIHNTDFINIR